MKTVSISGSLRENVGKKDAKKQRSNELVPCALYGGKEQYLFTAHVDSFKELIYSPVVYTVKLDIAGKEINAILQDIQYHPVTDDILHVDFLELFPDKYVTISVPVKTVGTSIGVLNGGKVQLKVRKLKIKSLPAHLPDRIEVDITKLEIGQSSKVVDIKLEGVQILNAPNSVVVTINSTRAAVIDANAAEAAK
ncbi:MAG: 50S ribosomal protein L25/general stress protein Ctc [Bacteroidetes bacterium]|nr:50S ribosomal protein L25/general stress protein Ctc [Bacteroidota bacterium]